MALKFKNNEDGLTLIEVLLSMVILMLVFLSVMKFFPMMGTINSINADKNAAVNMAKEVLINWQESGDVQWFVTKYEKEASVPNMTISSGSNISYNRFTYDSNYYYFETTKDFYNVKITIRRSVKTSSNLIRAYSIFIEFKNAKGVTVATTFGYIKK